MGCQTQQEISGAARQAERISRPNGILGFVKRLWKQARCKHTHCATYDLVQARRLYGNPFGARDSYEHGIQLCCCYVCGHVWVRDYRA